MLVTGRVRIYRALTGSAHQTDHLQVSGCACALAPAAAARALPPLLRRIVLQTQVREAGVESTPHHVSQSYWAMKVFIWLAGTGASIQSSSCWCVTTHTSGLASA